MVLIVMFHYIPLLTLISTLLCGKSSGFSLTLVVPKSSNVIKKTFSKLDQCRDTTKAMCKDEEAVSRSQFLSSLTKATVTLSSTIIFNSEKSNALEEEAISSSTKISSITPCPTKVNSNKNCVSTSNIKQLDNYLAPWTFECTPDEAFARLKGVIASEPSYIITDIDADSKYIKVETKRGPVFDEMEFLINCDDKVVIFRSGEKPTNGTDDEDSGGSLPDFGANRNRMDAIRKKATVFGVMGSGLTMDTYYGSPTGGNGPLRQLKTFYGLQSGKGFEDVILED